MSRLAHGIAVMCIVCAAPRAQETLEVKGPNPSLVELGGRSVVQLVVSGGEARPRRPEVPRVEGLVMRVDGPSESTFMRSDGRRRTVHRTVTYSIVLEPRREGRFEIPSFSFHTGTREQAVPRLVLECEKSVAGADKGFIELTPIPDTVYVGEPVQFVFDVGIDSRTPPEQRSDSLISAFISMPWFDQHDGMIAVEGVDGIEGDSVVPLVFNNTRQQTALTRDHLRNGRRFFRFTFTKTLMPTQAGTYDVGEPMMRFDFGGQRDFFDRRRGGERVFVYGEPVTVEVRELPAAGRPSGFGNAVGRFTLSSAVSDRRVSVGDSIKLVVTIRGRGNTEFLDVPELGDLDGFHLLGSNANRTRDAVVVEYDLTPLRADLTEVPAVTWSYFDTTPGVEKYMTVAADPIPIDVQPAAEGKGLDVLPGEDDESVTAGVDDIFDMKPIDAERAVRLPAAPKPLHATLLVLAPWIGCFLLAFLWRVQRRRRADVRGRRAAQAKGRFRSLLSDDPLGALAAYLADRLDVPEAAVIGPDLAERLMARGVDEALARDVQVAIDEGTAARYGGATGLDAARASELVGRLEPVKIGGSRVATVLLLACVLAGTLSAQRGARITAGERAYRDGDYATAAAEFASAAEQEGVDRRVFYNLGNSLFRDGRHAEALVAFERARLAMPRDPELLANIRVVERELGLTAGEGEPFLEALASIRDALTVRERLVVAILLNLLAAMALVFGGRALRWAGAVLLVPALAFAVEVAWLGPARPPEAIVLAPRVGIVAEPRDGLEPVLKVRRGVRVELLGETPAWASVRLDGRQGYVPRDAVGVIE